MRIARACAKAAALGGLLLVAACTPSYIEPDLPANRVATIRGERDTYGDRGMTIVISAIDDLKVADGLQRYRIEPGHHKIAIKYSGYGQKGVGELNLDAQAGTAYVAHGAKQGYYLFRAWIGVEGQTGP